MTAKNAYITIICAITLSVISLTIIFTQNTLLFTNSPEIGKPVMQDFAETDINEIKIVKPSSRSVNLYRNSDNQWSVGNYFNYPADKEKINNFLQELSSLKAVQAVNIEPSMLRALKLLPPSDKDKDSGTQILIIGPDKKIFFSLIAGLRRIDHIGSSNLTRGRYILVSPSQIPLLTEESLPQTKYSAKDFLSSSFITIKDIKEIKLFKNNTTLWEIIKKDQNAEFELLDKKREDPDINIDNVYSIVSSLESLKFDSVTDPATKPESSGLDKPHTIMIETFGGESYTIHVGKQFNNYRYVKIESNSFPLGKSWIYLIDNSRITPLIQTKKDLSTRKRKLQAPPDKIYSKPIS